MTFTRDGTPIQRAVTKNPSHYSSQRMNVPKLGVILSVRYADDPNNTSSKEYQDFRGFIAEAQVLLTNNEGILNKVFITPDGPTGLDNFEELLPRPSSITVTGQELNDNLTQIDLCDLDGDWCIVEFLNGDLKTPFISRYWPNPRNTYDPATSGKGNPVFATGQGRALDQKGRYFRRINGVEHVVTKEGNIWVSTARSGYKLKPGTNNTSNDGRFPRLNNDEGGSIIVNVKPSQLFELSFNEQVDGIGSDNLADSNLPQRNPALPSPIPKTDTSTRMSVNKDKITINTPISFNVRSKNQVLIDAPTINLGESPTSLAALANIVNDNFQRLYDAIRNAPITPGPDGGASFKAGILAQLIPEPSPSNPIPQPYPTDVSCEKVHIE
jgi:hypothetical protein